MSNKQLLDLLREARNAILEAAQNCEGACGQPALDEVIITREEDRNGPRQAFSLAPSVRPDGRPGDCYHYPIIDRINKNLKEIPVLIEPAGDEEAEWEFRTEEQIRQEERDRMICANEIGLAKDTFYGFEVSHTNDELSVELQYPPREPPETREAQERVRAVVISLMDVRAAEDVRVSFDFENDGWKLEQPITEGSINEPQKWGQVGFAPAFGYTPKWEQEHPAAPYLIFCPKCEHEFDPDEETL